MSDLTPRPFTIQQQIDFVAELRENFDNSQREFIQSKRPPEDVAELFKLIHENLIAVKLHQLAQEVKYCDLCNQPIRGVKMINDDWGAICERCHSGVSEHSNQTLGIP